MYRAAHAPDILSTADFGGQRKKGGQGKAPQKCGGRAGDAFPAGASRRYAWLELSFTNFKKLIDNNKYYLLLKAYGQEERNCLS